LNCSTFLHSDSTWFCTLGCQADFARDNGIQGGEIRDAYLYWQEHIEDFQFDAPPWSLPSGNLLATDQLEGLARAAQMLEDVDINAPLDVETYQRSETKILVYASRLIAQAQAAIALRDALQDVGAVYRGTSLCWCPESWSGPETHTQECLAAFKILRSIEAI
jgi:hypothetical protein